MARARLARRGCRAGRVGRRGCEAARTASPGAAGATLALLRLRCARHAEHGVRRGQPARAGRASVRTSRGRLRTEPDEPERRPDTPEEVRPRIAAVGVGWARMSDSPVLDWKWICAHSNGGTRCTDHTALDAVRGRRPPPRIPPGPARVGSANAAARRTFGVPLVCIWPCVCSIGTKRRWCWPAFASSALNAYARKRGKRARRVR
eukprot:3169055-Prymnesium_polylepis.1